MLKTTEIVFSPLFFAYFAFLCAFNGGELALVGLGSIFAHELAHIAAMIAAGAKVRGVTFLASRVRIDCDVGLLAKPAQALIFLAGPAANAVLGLALMRISPYASALNFALAAFNMLPVAALDGGRLCGLFLPRRFALALSFAATFAAAALMFYCVLASRSLPLALLVFMAVLAIVDGKI